MPLGEKTQRGEARVHTLPLSGIHRFRFFGFLDAAFVHWPRSIGTFSLDWIKVIEMMRRTQLWRWGGPCNFINCGCATAG